MLGTKNDLAVTEQRYWVNGKWYVRANDYVKKNIHGYREEKNIEA
ncbi:hypothetical protein RWE15_04260 [Virgibacillus halophilus]|uniref:Uncharacterized protein n=1 Tax=Tigheibacillus halophilus TaxID=361280 RepID=A0ABU5C3C4_9BACI|nr:hypothetical protein [Virgibacillus halophilus]